MSKLLFLLFIFRISCNAQENLVLLTKKRSSFLDNYRSYASLAIFQVDIPAQISFVSYKLSAEPFDLSIFGCSPEKVYVYAKKGSIPVLNPDNSRNPKWVKNITKSELYGLELYTDKEYSYINISSPSPGIYYFAAFFPYVNPDAVAIKQKGLSQHCTAFINILVYISKAKYLKLLTENYSYHIDSKESVSYYYQFLTTPNIKQVILKIKNRGNANSPNITLRLSSDSLPAENKYINTKTINLTGRKIEIPYWLNKDGQYFLEFDFSKNQVETSLDFTLDTISLDQTFRRKNIRTSLSNKLDPTLYKSAIIDYYENQYTRSIDSYTLYELIKESGSEAFLYTYNLNHENEREFMVPIPLNMTSDDFSVLKFNIEDIIDVGGTFEFSIDFRTQSNEAGLVFFSPEAVDQIIIGCISQDMYQIPTLPRFCEYNGVKTLAPVVINNTVSNSTVLIPFPESGIWYATIKLFCKPCQNCPCYKTCSEKLRTCVSKCSCSTVHSCNVCSKNCKAELEKKAECKDCNCDDKCAKSQGFCKSSIMFDLSSFPCVMGKCGPNGRCQYILVDGYIFSACQCRNKYRGMDCTDDSNATPFWKVVLGQILLISSNAIMLPCVYFAVKRKYYPEAVMYSSVLIFSSFYHACDVGDDAIQFCITTHSSLQFADFFSALFSIWATMLAISDLKAKHRSTLHVLAAIILAYCTVIDKTGVWIFFLITIPGIAIIGVCWYFKFRKSGKNFIKMKYLKFYFSTGIIVMLIGIMIFAFFQTSGNYMYLHSLWHCIVGITVLIILPRPDTFPTLEHLGTSEQS